jgi:hypothetical protein
MLFWNGATFLQQEIWRLRERHEAKQARMEKLLVSIAEALAQRQY